MKTALVLSGGGARGAFQAGALEWLRVLGIKYDFISGVSIGALNGAFLAYGTEDILQDTWLEEAKGFTLFPGRKLERLLKYHLEFRKQQIPFNFGIVSMSNGEYVNVDAGNVQDFEALICGLKASCSIPGIFPAVPEVKMKNGTAIKLGMDGGLRNVSPLRSAYEWAATQKESVRIISISTRTDQMPQMYSRNRLVLAGRALQVLMSEVQEGDMQVCEYEQDFTGTENEVRVTHIHPTSTLASPWDFSYNSIRASALAGLSEAKKLL